MATNRYIGARYVPKFIGTYNPISAYEALDVVDDGAGTSYIAKKMVPPGTPLNDTEYWFVYGASSGAIVSLQNRVTALENKAEDFINVLDYGFDNTGSEDNSTLIAALPLGKVWVFPAGTYLFDTPITLNDFRILAYGAVFKAGASLGEFITTKTADMSVLLNKNNFFYGGIIDGDYKVNTALKHTGGRACIFRDITIKNFNVCGLDIVYGGCTFDNIQINQEYVSQSDLPFNSVGIKDKGDCTIMNSTIVDCKTAIICGAGSNYISVFAWLSQDYLYDGSVAYKISEDIQAYFSGCSVDTIQTGFYFDGSYNSAVIEGTFWQFNTAVITDADILGAVNETCLFAKSSGSIINKIKCVGCIGELRDYHVKMFADDMMTVNNVANSYVNPRAYFQNFKGIANLSNVFNNEYHMSLNNQFSFGGHLSIDTNNTSFCGDVLSGTLVLQKDDSVTSWHNLTMSILGGLRDQARIPIYLSDNGYNIKKIAAMTISAAGTGTIADPDGDETLTYAIIPLNLIMKMNAVI